MLNDQTNLEFQAAAGDLKREIYQLGITLSLPHVLMRPKISIDGNQWCALYGDNLQDGVAGFGSSPCEAMGDFDRAWNTRLKPNDQAHSQKGRERGPDNTQD
jgi:hypothetical protein